ncbi:MAG TPA: hypothetical protein VJ933_00610 [Phaeodactylibacter sp.]|nr:hypothetical protein [Phaeodactylibacter sp.]
MNHWTRFGFEFLSIFIAVIAAFALDNWNENRKERLAESKILIEISNGLDKDLEDININMFGHEEGIKATQFFKEVISGKAVTSDSVLQHYFSLTRDFVSIQNTSGYETLKSRGLELIDNDSLRTKIISLYEYDYTTLKKLEEEYYELQFQENYFEAINRAVAPHFIIDDNMNITGLRTPIQLPEDEKKTLLSYLWKIGVNRNFILQYYKGVKAKIKAIQKEINES